MAALLALFRSPTPPVVKRRAKELLSVITEVVKKISSSEPTEPRAEDQLTEGSSDIQVDSQKASVVMLDDELKNLEKGEKQTIDIWGG